MIPSTITYKFGRCDIASCHPNVLYLLYLGSVNDQRKYLSLFFIRNDSRCYAAGKHDVPSKNKDVKFFVKTLSQRLTKNISLTSMHFLLVPRAVASVICTYQVNLRVPKTQQHNCYKQNSKHKYLRMIIFCQSLGKCL